MAILSEYIYCEKGAADYSNIYCKNNSHFYHEHLQSSNNFANIIFSRENKEKTVQNLDISMSV